MEISDANLKHILAYVIGRGKEYVQKFITYDHHKKKHREFWDEFISSVIKALIFFLKKNTDSNN